MKNVIMMIACVMFFGCAEGSIGDAMRPDGGTVSRNPFIRWIDSIRFSTDGGTFGDDGHGWLVERDGGETNFLDGETAPPTAVIPDGGPYTPPSNFLDGGGSIEDTGTEVAEDAGEMDSGEVLADAGEEMDASLPLDDAGDMINDGDIIDCDADRHKWDHTYEGWGYGHWCDWPQNDQ